MGTRPTDFQKNLSPQYGGGQVSKSMAHDTYVLTLPRLTCLYVHSGAASFVYRYSIGQDVLGVERANCKQKSRGRPFTVYTCVWLSYRCRSVMYSYRCLVVSRAITGIIKGTGSGQPFAPTRPLGRYNWLFTTCYTIESIYLFHAFFFCLSLFPFFRFVCHRSSDKPVKL